MLKFFDAMDDWFDRHSVLAWALTFAFIALVMWLNWMTKTTTAMLLLAVPGIYMMGRSGGVMQIIRFCVCMGLFIIILALALNQTPCGGWGEGLRMFYNIRCE
jgi:hypothetical protein